MWPSGRWHKTVNLAGVILTVGSNPIVPAKLQFMDVKQLSSRSFIVGGTTYTVQVPITLDEALQEIQTTLSEIKEKKKYYEGLLKKLNFLIPF